MGNARGLVFVLHISLFERFEGFSIAQAAYVDVYFRCPDCGPDTSWIM
jgi:hypothetical protein